MTSISSEAFDPLPLDAEADVAASGELRREGRVQTVYQPCCLRFGNHCNLGLIRNVSQGGLMVETDLDAPQGAEIEYFQETAHWRRARVVWREGRRMGLNNIDEAERDGPHFPHRSLRIPTSLVARLWVAGQGVEVGIGNISNKGVLAFGVPPIACGNLVTLTIAGREFANTSLRWWADGSAGFAFERPMSMRALTELLELASRRSSGMYYERSIGDLLEVVPANDRRG
jgi:hypothetical protein